VTEPAQPVSYKADIVAAGDAIRQAIADTEGPLPPHFLVEFLMSQWRRYLVLAHHDHGADSEQWREAVDITRRLLFSVLPVTSVQQRQSLAKTVPQLIADLKKGASIGGIETVTLDIFLKQLGNVHLAKLDPKRPLDPPKSTDLSDTVTMDVRDPRYRALLDHLDGKDGVEHIEM
jgi:Protein of unknown function (DUF1631)